MKAGYYCADAVRGVYYFGDIIEDPEANVMHPRVFADSLKYAQEPIYSWFDESRKEIFAQIDLEYGIND